MKEQKTSLEGPELEMGWAGAQADRLQRSRIQDYPNWDKEWDTGMAC